MPTGTPAASTTAPEEQEDDPDYVDPLDAYMASIASEVAHQAPLGIDAGAPPPTPPAPRTATATPLQLPSPAQLAVAKKVAASPFCDVLLRGKGERLRASGGGSGGDGSENNGCHGGGGGEAEQACLGLLLAQPAEFLRLCQGSRPQKHTIKCTKGAFVLLLLPASPDASRRPQYAPPSRFPARVWCTFRGVVTPWWLQHFTEVLGLAPKAEPPTRTLPRILSQVTNARMLCLGILDISRYGHILAPADLESFLPTEDPGVSVHVARLRALISQQQQQHQQHQPGHPPTPTSDTDDVDMTPVGTAAATAETTAAAPAAPPVGWGRDSGHLSRPCPPDSARVRNRRYRRLQQLAEGGVWFSDEAMKERDPWLWFEYVGKRAGEEKPAPRQAVEEVPGSTSVGTYLQESLGFLSQQQKGEWPTGIPNAVGAGAAGAGSSLGMAFLSGMSAGAEGVVEVQACFGQGVMEMDMPAEERRPKDTEPVDVAAGATIDASDLPTSSPAAGPTVPSRGNGDSDNNTAAVTAAVEAFGIRDEGREIGGGDGGGGRGVVHEEGSRARVRFVDQEGAVLEREQGEEEEEEEDGEQEEEEEEEEEEDDAMECGVRAGGREEVARILSERFLAGEEEGVDYRDVDGDERLDDLDQLARDEQDRWFRGEEDRASSMGD